MGHMGSAHGAKAKRLFVPGMGHLWDIWDINSTEYNGDIGDMRLLQHQWGLNGDILPVDIGHEMGPVLAKRGRERKGLKRMIRFYREYPGLVEKVPQAVAPLTDLSSRLWYMQKSEYELTRVMPDSLKSALPTIEEIEAVLEGKEAGYGE